MTKAVMGRDGLMTDRPRFGSLAMALAGLVAFFSVVPTPAMSQQGPLDLKIVRIQPPVLPNTFLLYPEGALPKTEVVERWDTLNGERLVRNVVHPTLTAFLPEPSKATGAAVIVAPGGAYMALSMDNEGWPVARWLAERGIAAFVLKYRLNETPDDENAFLQAMGARFAAAAQPGRQAPPEVSEPRATDDALQALRLIRSQAKRWNVDPDRVGTLGFSAGAMTALQAVLKGAAAERPDFLGYIYGPMTAVQVPAEAPPMFAALALDDDLFGRQGFGIVDAWHKAGRPVELHAYEKGHHGFGMGKPGTTTTLLMDEFRAWLDGRGLLAKKTGQ